MSILADDNVSFGNVYTGGNINFTKNNYVIYLLIGLCIVIVLIVVFSGRSDDKYKKLTYDNFRELHGDTFDKTAKQTIEYGERIKDPSAIDHYRIGTAYLVNAEDPRKANAHFRKALNKVIEGKVQLDEAPYIIERIDEYKDRFTDFPDIEDLPLQQALLANFNARKDRIQQAQTSTEIKAARATVPNFVQKAILSRQHWESESQNVHDSAIYSELKEQIYKVRDLNAKIPNIETKDYNYIINWLKLRYKNEPDKEAKLDKVVTFLNNNYPTRIIDGVNEQDVLVAVWRRSYDPINADRVNQIREAVGDAVLDCVEGNNVVCIDGRLAKVWQSLATVDKDPTIGVFKSKQMVRNEIFEACAKIVDDYVGKNGTVSEHLKESYNKGERTEQVTELIECIHKQMDEVKDKYAGLLPDDAIELLITECKAVV